MSEPRSKLIGGHRFTEGDVFVLKGLGFITTHLTKRGIILRPFKPKPKAEVMVTDMTPNELFLAVQPDEQARREAAAWIKLTQPTKSNV